MIITTDKFKKSEEDNKKLKLKRMNFAIDSVKSILAELSTDERAIVAQDLVRELAFGDPWLRGETVVSVKDLFGHEDD